MGDRFDRAQREIGARMDALGVTGDEVTVVVAVPDELTRAIMSGYVPTEDVDQALAFVEEGADAMLRLVGEAASARAIRAGLRATLAQIIAIGVALERQGERQLEGEE